MSRSGLVAKKLGMTSIFTEDGGRDNVTVLDLDGCVVVGKRDKEKDGYSALQVGAGKAKLSRLSKAEKGFFAKQKVEPTSLIREFRCDSVDEMQIGDFIGPEYFSQGQFVDIKGVSKGKGFAGVIKRHNFGGLRASHGVSVSHRSHGSTGGCQDPGRVFKNKKMAGHMGAENVTVQNIRVVGMDQEKKVLFVKGGVPGAKGSWVSICDAVKKSVSK